MSGDSSPKPWDGLIGQQVVVDRLTRAATQPVHAYLFLGSPGTGTRRAANGFAALLLSEGLDAESEVRARRLALAGTHPDLIIVEAEGSTLRVEEANEIIRAGQTSPVEGARKVIVVTGVDDIQEAAIGKLLKLIEEPPASTVFVLLADDVPPEIITIASRCVTVEFAPLATAILEAALVGEAIPVSRAKAAAAAAGGDLERARLLARDDALSARAELWRTLPDRLDGRGVTVWELTQQIRDALDQAQEPLNARQAEELADLDARVERTGERGSGRSVLVARHKRETRRHRNDELRFGFATLARNYRDRLLLGANPQAEAALAAVRTSTEALIRNPNEALLLQGLLLRLVPAA